MATDKLSVDLLLNTRKAERELAKLNKEFAKLGKTMGGAFGGPGKGGDKVRALGTGLSKATVKADEFTKSLEASNARVVAFGASAGIIMQIDRAFKGLVTSTMKVEKALLDVNVVLNASTKQLQKFGAEMFKIARGTAQSFEVVAEATTELARQGLGTEKTLKRTNDALILTRLTGMNAADSVKSLTAAVNSFNKEGVTSAQVINRMAKVDAAFAVSSEDLAKSISRVGASAVSAGVSMNELMAITTAVQQRTARGGAVIGNAFKTIFTRIQRSDVLQKLRNIGVAVTDMNGNMLSGMQVIQNLANNFDKLSKSQQASVSESVAGVFQVNILKAAMSDLSSATSHYKGALHAANSATDEAYKRNEQLNQSLDALANRTLANLTQAGAAIGGGTLEPAIKRVLSIVNTSMESFGKGGVMEGFGQTWGKGIMKGLGDFIAGPGLVLVVATIGKLFFNLTKFTGKAFADIMGINRAAQQRVTIEGAIVDTLAKEPALLSSILSGDKSILTVEQQILATIRKQNLERQAMQIMATPIAGSLMGRGLHVGRSGGMSFKGGGRAGGFVPNFANAGSERAAAAAGGYTAGAIRTMHQPGAGTMMYNSAETVKRFPGMSQSAIMPPQGSPAGAGYKSAFGAAHGFDPYAGSGFVPNFAGGRVGRSSFKNEAAVARQKGKPAPVGLDVTVDVSKLRDLGIVTEEGSKTSPISFGQQVMGPKGIPALRNKLPKKMMNGADGKILESLMLRISPLPVIPIFPIKQNTDEMSNLVGKFPSLQNSLNEYAENIAHQLFPKSKARAFNMDNLSKGTEGDIFEEGLRAAVQEQGLEDRRASFDYSGPEYAHKKLIAFMNKKGANLKPRSTKLEAKIGAEAAISGNIAKKVVNDALAAGMNVGPNINSIVKAIDQKYKATAGGEIGQLTHTGVGGTNQTGRRTSFGKWRGKAMGHIPNFALSPLTSAIGREMQAGVPSSAIRVGSSPSLRSAGNPGGVGVYNTIHEPGGLQQGISRARAQGVSPKSHGVPNFATGGLILPDPVVPGWKLRELEAQKKATDRLIAAKTKEATVTAAATRKTGMFGKMMGGLSGKSTGIGMGLGLIVPSIVNTMTQGSEPGSTGARAGSAASQAAMWGGTGMMVHPLVGLAGTVGGGLFGWFSSAIEDASQSVEELTKGLTELSQKEDRTAETFNRISMEMDKLNKKAFGNDRTRGLQSQRNIMKEYLRKEYGVADPKTGTISVSEGLQTDLDLVDTAITGKGMLEVGERVRKRGVSGINTVRVQAALAKAAEEDALGMAVLERGRGAFGGRRGISPEFTPFPRGGTRGLPEHLRTSAGFRSGFVVEGSEAFKKRQQLVSQPGLAGITADPKMGIPFQIPTEGAGIKSLVSAAQAMMGAGARTTGLSFAEELFFDKGTKKGRTEIAGRQVDTMLFDKKAAEGSITKRLSGLRDLYDSPMTRRGEGNRGVGLLVNSMMDLAGVDEKDKAKVKKSLMDTANKIATERKDSGVIGMGDTTSMEVLKEMAHEMLNKPYTELDDLHSKHVEAEKARLAAAEKAIIEYEKNLKLYRKEVVILNEFGKSLKEASLEAKHQVSVQKQVSAFTQQTLSISQRGGMSTARATMNPFGVAEVTRRHALQKAGGANISARTDAFTQAQFSAGEAGRKTLTTLRKNLMKDLLEGGPGISAGVLKERRQALEGLGLGGLGDKSIDELRIELKTMTSTLADLESKAGLIGDAAGVQLSQTEQTTLKALQDAKPAVEGVIKSYENAVDLADRKLKQQEEIANKSLKVQQQEIRNRMVFNSQMRDFNQLTAYMLAQQESADATGLAKTGRISGRTMAGRYKNAVETRRNRFGLGNMDKEAGESFSLGFKGAMTYNNRDYLDELEDGSRQVATTMKSSFADAFKSIASGASSAEDAMAQFAGNILNTISDMSAKMATNMMFAKMGFSEGGHIPRYGGGGVVTGGSGMKDDVLSMMNGGEYVIKKSSAKKIGYDTLNAINSGGVSGFAEGGAPAGGGGMGKMFAVSAAASAASGLISGQWGKSKKKPWRGQDYGKGRGEYGYFGGPDSDAGGRDSIAGGGRGAQVSLNKAYVYYRRDPETGKLVSERVRPTEGKYEVSGALSLLGRLNADDRQTGRMFGKEQKMGAYSDYLFGETERRKEVMKAHKKQKKGRLISAYMNAAMMIGGSYMMGKTGASLGPDVTGPDGMSYGAFSGSGGEAYRLNEGFLPVSGGGRAGEAFGRKVPLPPMPPGYPRKAQGGSVGGSPALLTGGEYVMGADTVRQYGLDFMGELNRGGVPGMAAGGPVSRGNQGAIAGMVAGGETNNNVNISINVDKRGNVEAKAAQGPDTEDNSSRENTVKDAENNKELGKALQSVVLQELIRQQRPGGLLRN